MKSKDDDEENGDPDPNLTSHMFASYFQGEILCFTVKNRNKIIMKGRVERREMNDEIRRMR